MGKGHLEAFTDGVMAIIITIIVLEIKVPSGTDLAAFSSSLPILFTYALSFLNVGIFWNNHHHMLHAATHVDGKVPPQHLEYDGGRSTKQKHAVHRRS